MINRARVLAAALLLTLPTFATLADSGLPTTWRDTPRDVYIDGSLIRPSQVLVTDSPKRIAVFAEPLRDVLVIDLDNHKSWSVAAREWTPAKDRMTATCRANAPKSHVRTSQSSADGTHFASLGRRSIVVKTHQSAAGSLDASSVWRDFPSWGGVRDAYVPSAEAVARLATIDRPTKIHAVFATWCGDSRYYLPRLAKAIEAAHNPNLELVLTGIGPDFHTPLGFVQEHHVINVPTFIVERDGVELGRITETPATDTAENDIALIASGDVVPVHTGRLEREARTGSGRYDIVSRDGIRSTEQWETFRSPEGGELLHSTITSKRGSREIWQSRDEKGAVEFVEITERTGSAVHRTRYRIDGKSVSAHSRGSATGIIDQVVALSGDCNFESGSIAALSWCDPTAATVRLLDCYRAGDCEIAGAVEQEEIRVHDERSAMTIGGVSHDGRRVTRKTSDGMEELLVSASGLPLRLTRADGSVATLVELTNS